MDVKYKALALDRMVKMAKKREFKQKPFEFLEHTADAYIAAYGENLEEVFENAALAMFEVMTDTSKIGQTLVENVEVRAADELALLYNWLELFIIKFEVENRLYSRFEIKKIRKSNSEFFFSSKIYGENFNPDKHPSKVQIKAITYHRMEIKNNEFSMARFILDI